MTHSLTGETLAHFQIGEKLGAGAMGEVYRAKDTRLGRDVAIKVLPETLAHDPERLARFEREARVLASLNHPNIAILHGFEKSEGRPFLVMEVVAGDTLAELLARSPMSIDEVVAVFRQIAEGMEAAHEKNVVHRDLKPANIKVAPDGKVKLLDFGLAKAFAGGAHANQGTEEDAVTATGMVLGTAAYMSPEQALGRETDARADIWSFGCVLYEALARRRVFSGRTLSETVLKVLQSEPDWGALSPSTPPSLVRLLRRCLEKDVKRRLRHVGDARLELDDAFRPPPVTEATRRGRRRIPAGFLLRVFSFFAIAVLAGVAGWNLKTLEPRPSARLALSLPVGVSISDFEAPALALSPDGSRLVFVARSGGERQLYLRKLDESEARPLAGTEGASSPFFSPDGLWIGFFSGGKMKKVSISGGVAIDLAEARIPLGASWLPQDLIVFAPQAISGLSRVSSSGGTSGVLTIRDADRGEVGHRWPVLLSGGTAVMFSVSSDETWDDARIMVQSLETGERRAIIDGAAYAQFVPTGHIVYARAGALWAIPFDSDRLQVTGTASRVLEGVLQDPSTGAAQFSFSRQGMLAYVPDASPSGSERSLVWVDRGGVDEPLSVTGGPLNARLSPDGRRLAATRKGARSEVWICDLADGKSHRLTSEADDAFPVWTPDGARVVFQSSRGGAPNLYRQLADGTGVAERLTTSENAQVPVSVSPDNRVLAYVETHPTTGHDIWLLPLDELAPLPYLQTPADERGAMISPDGGWLGYSSNDSGRFEVYVRALSGGEDKWQVSTEGGTDPVWSRDGRELFYRNGDDIMVAGVAEGPSFRTGSPLRLLRRAHDTAASDYSTFDVAPDGKRFLMVQAGEPPAGVTELNVVLEWFDDLKRRLAGTKPSSD